MHFLQVHVVEYSMYEFISLIGLMLPTSYKQEKAVHTMKLLHIRMVNVNFENEKMAIESGQKSFLKTSQLFKAP